MSITESISSNESIISTEDRKIQPTILGRQKENPFSVENMEIALDSLRAYANEIEGGVNLKSVSEIQILPTDLYVRFLPKDSVEYETLVADTSLTLFDIPLDYDIVQLGDYYYDSTLTTPYTWKYTTVKPNYEPPKGVQYEVLSELFIIENSEDYTEELLSDTIPPLKSTIKSGIINQDICNALYAISFTLTGNEDELSTYVEDDTDDLKSTITRCTRKCFGRRWWKVCWRSCDTYYYPDGQIKLKTPRGDVGLKGLKVRMWRWFSYTDARTDSRGYYYSKARFNKIWINNSISYRIIFTGRRDDNSWTFKKSIAGAFCLWRDSYGLGRHSPDGYSTTFTEKSDYWGRCVLNNAIYDYIFYAKKDGLALPPSHLDIADKNTSKLKCSAPLLRSHLNFSMIKSSSYWGTIATMAGYELFGWAFPDLILRYNNNEDNYEEITAVCWHELTHASQLQRMKSEKSYFWASDYWSTNVYQQAKNDLDTDNPYGNKGDSNWQQIALSEGWANYREELMVRNILGKSSYVGTTNSLLSPYVQMFKKLKNVGCSYSNMEKALCTYSITGYRDKLIAKYPSIRDQITKIIAPYE